MGAVVVVLVAVVAVAVALAPSSSPRSGSSSHTSSGHSAVSSSHTTVSSGHTSSQAATRSGSSSHHHTSQTTAPATIQADTSSATSVSYTAPASAYTIDLTASGPCWVYATDTATGKVLWTGTLQVGGSQAIPATGNITVRLGAAFDVTISLDSKPVILPAGHGSPYDVIFKTV